MADINQTFIRLSNLSSTELLTQPTDTLRQILQYLYNDLTNDESKFSKCEHKFASGLKYTISNTPSGLKKLLSFLISETEKSNLQLLKEIDILFEKKKTAINKLYEKDISIVEEFLRYASQKFKNGELFYYEPYFENYAWTKREFPKNMFNYLAHKIRTNPNSLTTQYIEDMKGHFSLVGLGLQDEKKVTKANHYFTKTRDPFSFNIPDTYNDVRSEILMSVANMSENENLLGRIANDIIKKYGE